MAEQDGRRTAGGRCTRGPPGATVRDLAEADRTVGFGAIGSNGSSVNLCGDRNAGDVRAHLAEATDAAAPVPESRPPSVRRKFRTLTFGRRCKTKVKAKESSGKKQRSKGAPWNFKFNCRLKRAMGSGSCKASDIPEPGTGCDACVCTGYRRTEEHHLGAGVVFQVAAASGGSVSAAAAAAGAPEPAIDLLRFNPDDYPIDDWEERARAERARELEEGVDPPPGYRPAASPQLRLTGPREERLRLSELAAAFQSRLAVGGAAGYSPRYEPRHQHPDPALSTETHLISQFAHVTSQGACVQRTVHTQVDYIHCLVPDLREITDCGFYWGKMDRYEAEKLLEAKAEGTFLLRDSAQEEYLFSVSFRRYSRSLHARIEQWNHRFSFDSHDPGVFASETVCGLIEHYKDPGCCMFFEPMLTIPLHRTFPFPLQHLCRSVICKATSYDGVNELRLPKSTKAYLKEYHYKQRVRVRRFEMEH